MPARKRRGMIRRDTDEQVDRLFTDGKLARFDKKKLEGCSDKSGVLLRQYLSEKVRESRGRKAYITVAVWKEVFDRFPLLESSADRLEVPRKAEKVNDTLVEKISLLHNDNPNKRSCNPLTRFLEYCDELNYTELVGTIKAAQESPVVTRQSSTACMIAILEYGARRLRVLFRMSPPLQTEFSYVHLDL